ncbi:type II secretion system protein [Ruminococcus sp.]|uniref:type II secretion system protein n=1 Tax=Ruminococcus sp. TaxID=41978 RepID=UPI0025D5E4A4|nr:type II secretion system protein [Ruminococcus sp.]MBQ9542939.1 type II secretion system protein [Ruminococcus sp.]
MKNSNKKGFTLVELVVVIAIIGVLAAILVPSMMGYVKKSRLKTANGNAKTAYNAAAEAIADAETQGHPFASISADTGVITASVEIAADHGWDNDYIAAVMTNALASNGADAGEACAFGDTTASSVWHAQWRKTADDTTIGQYPEAPASVDAAEALDWGAAGE